jgi:Carboxypeptidase regulatory-like domain
VASSATVAPQTAPPPTVTTAADGGAAISELDNGVYLLAVSAPGYGDQTEEVMIAKGREAALEIRLRSQSASLEGRVVRAGSAAPIAGAKVAIGDRETDTDADGRYSLIGIPPGTYTLQVGVANHQVYDSEVTLRPGRVDTRDVTLAPVAGMLRVRVVDDLTGRPIEGTTIVYGLSPTANAPCADSALLVPLKRSREYRAIRPRVAELLPIDSWLQDELHFFVFRLKPENGTVLPEPPLAVFTMHADAKEPVSAVTVTPDPDGQAPVIADLRRGEPNGAVSSPGRPVT